MRDNVYRLIAKGCYTGCINLKKNDVIRSFGEITKVPCSRNNHNIIK